MQAIDDCIIRACVYGDRQRRWHEAMKVHPALLKSREFDYQTEVRAIWEPISRPLRQHLDIECRAATKLLSLHEIPDADRKLSGRSRHALRFDNEELLRQTYALTDRIIDLINELKANEVNASEIHAELNRRLDSGLRREIAELVREYANRGLRDRRIEEALDDPQNLPGITDFPSTLQRLGELFEIRIAKKNGRLLRLQSKSHYRFWRGLRPPFHPLVGLGCQAPVRMRSLRSLRLL